MGAQGIFLEMAFLSSSLFFFPKWKEGGNCWKLLSFSSFFYFISPAGLSGSHAAMQLSFKSKSPPCAQDVKNTGAVRKGRSDNNNNNNNLLFFFFLFFSSLLNWITSSVTHEFPYNQLKRPKGDFLLRLLFLHPFGFFWMTSSSPAYRVIIFYFWGVLQLKSAGNHLYKKKKKLLCVCVSTIVTIIPDQKKRRLLSIKVNGSFKKLLERIYINISGNDFLSFFFFDFISGAKCFLWSIDI